MFPNFLKIIIIITIGDQEKNGSREKDKKKITNKTVGELCLKLGLFLK